MRRVRVPRRQKTTRQRGKERDMDPKTGNNQQGNKPRAQGSGSDTVSAANLASGGAGQTAHPGQSATLASHTSKPMGGSQTGSGQSSQGPGAPAPPGQGRRQGSRRSGARRRQPSRRHRPPGGAIGRRDRPQCRRASCRYRAPGGAIGRRDRPRRRRAGAAARRRPLRPSRGDRRGNLRASFRVGARRL